MIEAIPFIFLFIVAVASYTSARLHVANPENHSAREDVIRLRQQRAWLEERLRQARRENWDQAMRLRIADELEAMGAKLAKATSAPNEATT